MIFTFIASILSAIFYQNIVLTTTAGIESGLNDESRVVPVIKYGAVVSIFTLLIFLVSYPIYQYLLIPTQTTFMSYMIVALLIIGGHALGVYILNKTQKNELKEIFSKSVINSAVIFITLLGYQESNFFDGLALVLGSLLGYMLIMVLLTTIQTRLKTAPDDLIVKGFPMMLILLGVLAVVFKGLAGIF